MSACCCCPTDPVPDPDVDGPASPYRAPNQSTSRCCVAKVSWEITSSVTAEPLALTALQAQGVADAMRQSLVLGDNVYPLVLLAWYPTICYIRVVYPLQVKSKTCPCPVTPVSVEYLMNDCDGLASRATAAYTDPDSAWYVAALDGANLWAGSTPVATLTFSRFTCQE